MPSNLSDAASSVVALHFMEESDIAPFDAAAREGKTNLLTDLVSAKRITALQSHEVFARLNGYMYANLDDAVFQPTPELLRAIPASTARDLKVVPFRQDGERIIFATGDPNSLDMREQLTTLFPNASPRYFYAPAALVDHVIASVYSAAEEARLVGENDEADFRSTVSDDANLGLISDNENDAVVQILRLLIEQAVKDNVSDIHIEPTSSGVRVRFRIDGDLRVMQEHTKERGDRLVKLVKVEARLEHGSSRKPESGAFTRLVGTRQVDVRVEASPQEWGEEVTLRVQTSLSRNINELGFSEKNLTRFKKAYSQPFGLVLATGPTGSGKSSTEYSTLAELTDDSRKIVTLENPVETKIGRGVSQTSINEAQGLTFALGLRSILRRDPDIILVGEIRDDETAGIAVEAALTGHLLLSTLHTNDAPGAIVRLRELGILPSLLSEALVGVVAQRLVKRLCIHCRVPLHLSEEEREELGFGGLPAEGDFFTVSENGCDRCGHIGYRGRIPIHEVMLVDSKLRGLISRKAEHDELVDAAREGGMTSLREDGWEKAAQGIIDPYQLASVVSRDL
ncbi:hypothetical protein GCM10025867_47310 (plasmid) [Frondihabitans sucicola]|uniref:Bacterial type II secretion system protein E domain-containing protein n=1 Tax=Frondihabitans sucicola TaxID=1268041 RepID=A0ABM8GVJ1_9MICO|nr:GspE/PulE family protein [Frondihabitans sucicola]BDZ52490.1 hypothetical protein GCM10025867_47310 [Frondihabitans sucicola]